MTTPHENPPGSLPAAANPRSAKAAREGMTGPGIEHGSPTYAIVRLVAGLLLMTVGTASMYVGMVGLKPVAMEFGISRSLGSVPYALFMVGYGIGGVVMGRLADRFGILVPLLIGTVAVPMGLYLAGVSESFWQYLLALAVLAGLIGSSVTFSPVVADITHWFTARRGFALAVVISGSYLAGAIWPPIMQGLFDALGWREALKWVALISFVTMLPLALLFWRKPAHMTGANDGSCDVRFTRPLGLRPNLLQGAVCCAGIGCCVAMSMPQVHIVSYASDLGYTAQRGAEMLSLMLGFGIISRLASGWISDRIGGLKTLLLGSAMQGGVLAAFLGADSLTALYTISACFGLAQGGVVPSYAVIIRTYFPPGEAGARIGLALFFTIMGMALGGFLAGILYDLTGSYTVSFINALAFNVMNFSIVGVLLLRARRNAVVAS